MADRPLGVDGIRSLYENWRRFPWSRKAGAAPTAGGLPAVILLGPPKSGKTLTLDALASLGSRRPLARHSFAAGEASGPREVLAKLAMGLSLGPKHEPPLRFPRLTVDLLAVQPALTLDQNIAVARQQLRAALHGPRRPVDGAAGVVGALAQLNLPKTSWLGALSVVLQAPPRLPLALARRAALSWHAQGGMRDPYNELIALNQLSRSTTAANVTAVDVALFTAFLEDLRADHERGRRDTRCVVLLDDVDHPGGREFLEALVAARNLGPSDPLVVVCSASKTDGVPGVPLPDPEGLLMSGPEEASFEDWTESITVAQPQARDVYCIRLRDLTVDEVQPMWPAAARQVPRLPVFVHGLTGGHPVGTRLLLDTVSGGAQPTDAARLRGLFTGGGTPQDHRLARPSVEDALRPLLLEFTADQQNALTICAAARDFGQAREAGLLDGFSVDTQRTLVSEVAARLWLSTPSPQDASARGGRGTGYLEGPPPTRLSAIHPWLRLLLLAQLAYPEDGAAPRPAGLATWENVHQRLENWNRRQGRTLDRLYHALARGAMDPVVTYLDDRLKDPEAGVPVWLYELYTITSAPLKDPCLPHMSAVDRVDKDAEELAPVSYRDRHQLTVLVTALQLAADPRNKAGARPELNPTIRAMFQHLGTLASPRRRALLDEARRFE